MPDQPKKPPLDIDKVVQEIEPAVSAETDSAINSQQEVAGQVVAIESTVQGEQQLKSVAQARRLADMFPAHALSQQWQDKLNIGNTLIGRLGLGSHLTDHSTALAVALNSRAWNDKLLGQATQIGEAYRATDAWTRDLSRLQELARSQHSLFSVSKPFTADVYGITRIGAVSELMRKKFAHHDAFATMLAKLESPWLKQLQETRSMAALTELHGIGNALNNIHGYNHALTKALRLDLGDWRDRVTLNEAVVADPVGRAALYVERGFNTSLTDFPDRAFQTGLQVAGLGIEDFDENPPDVDAKGSNDDIEEAALRRNNKCHDYLQRLERRLRIFIDQAMTAQYGTDWPRHRLQKQTYDAWQEKRERAERNGASVSSLIELADFTDYENIICRRDHWREIFVNQFIRQESVRESFQRLYPLRIATMHARLLTKEDELYLIAEAMRLLGAIKRE
ncbi:MAG: hypothetical protein JWR07_868 [Nevskia sp.]|nr:hypothetical protein [Nevskia sp.]